MHKVFVYGTLKRGFPYAAELDGERLLGRHRTREPYPLVVGGRWFSPILIAEPGNGLCVFGEVYEVGDEKLAHLDGLEGTHHPLGYTRITIAVAALDGADDFAAWTYVKDRTWIDVIHSDPMDEYRLDPRYVPAHLRTT